MSDTTRKGRRRGSSAAPAFSGLATDECGPDSPVPYSVVSPSAPTVGAVLPSITYERTVDAGVETDDDGFLREWDGYHEPPTSWTKAEIYPAAGALYDKALRLLCEKHLSYGATNISRAPGGSLLALRVRLHDKMARLNHILDTDGPTNDESLQDTLLDAANYCMIGLLVLNGDWPE